MGERLTFIHAADLHIGAPFRGLRELSPQWADRLLQAVTQAYDRIIEVALARQVDFVIIAGDIFDTAQASYADYLHFFKGLERLSDAGIWVYLCTGNHDPYHLWEKDFYTLPKHVHMFDANKPDFALYEKDGRPLCVLGGRGYPHRVWSENEDIADGITRTDALLALGERVELAPFGVGVLHTGLHLDAVKAPVDPVKLQSAGFDYWALGHIHRRYIDNAQNPRMGFSGCIQGRDIKETGSRGVYLVTLETNVPNRVEFVPTASVVWEQLQVDASGCKNIPELSQLITREQFRANGDAHCDEMVFRVTLVGASPLHTTLATPGVLDDVRTSINESYPAFFIDALIDHTSAPIDVETLLREGMFPATFIHTSQTAAKHLTRLEGTIQDAFVQKNIPSRVFTKDDIKALIQEAEALVLDELFNGAAHE